jgi:DNA polymerase-3 subunit chi
VAEVGFYHLTRTSADQALPPLLGRTLAAGKRALVRLGSAARVAALDQALWLCPDPDWLPHGAGDPDLQPIFLTEADAAPNGATYLFLLDGTDTADAGRYERIFDLFDGSDTQAVEAARRRWTVRAQEGHKLTYWKQGAKGWTC